MRLAIFDVDGTLVSGKSTEKRFIAWLWRRGHLGPRQALAAAWFVLRWFPLFGRHVFRKNKAYLEGLSEDLVTREATRFADELHDSIWIEPAVAELRRHKEQGDVVVLMSGTLQPIVETLSRRLGGDDAIGTICRIRDGRYTATPPVQHPFYDDKAALLASICERHQVPECDACAYADSVFDIPLMGKVGQAIAVCPDQGLATWAKLNKHRIIEFDR